MREVVRCFLFDNDKILIVKHNKNTKWTLPWWHIEANETMYEALEREMKEEFNLKIKLTNRDKYLNYWNITEFSKPLSIYSISYNSQKHWNVTKLEYIFVAELLGGELKAQEEEIYDYKWFTKQELISISDDVYPQVIDMLNLL